MVPKLTVAEMDMLALRRIPLEHRSREVEAIQARWWDYRLMHPTAATYEFAHEYQAATERWWSRYIDEQTVKKARAFKADDVFESQELTAVWLARQSVDLLGVPYDFAMEFIIDRSLKREFRHLMRPNQIYGEDVEIDLAAAWQERMRASLRTSTHGFFKVVSYSGHAMQRDYRRWLIEQIKARPAPHHRLLARLYLSGDIDADMVRGEFSLAELEDMHRYARMLTLG